MEASRRRLVSTAHGEQGHYPCPLMFQGDLLYLFTFSVKANGSYWPFPGELPFKPLSLSVLSPWGQESHLRLFVVCRALSSSSHKRFPEALERISEDSFGPSQREICDSDVTFHNVCRAYDIIHT